MMSTRRSKHVEAWNKYIKKECVKLVINQNYAKMHGKQNIKSTKSYGVFSLILLTPWESKISRGDFA
jgi:hypothetical protein